MDAAELKAAVMDEVREQMGEGTVLRLSITDELKELRKGVGLDLKRPMKSGTVLSAAVGNDPLHLVRLFKEQADIALLEGFHALMNALAVPVDIDSIEHDQSADLTARRSAFAEKHDISERTLARYEDRAIHEMADRLARLFMADETYRERIETRYTPTKRPAAPSYANDLPSLVIAQSVAIEQLTRQLDSLRQTNARLAKLLGVET